MIVWNVNIKKSNDIIKGVNNELYKKNINIDGVVEPFNNGVEKGMVLKLYDSYNEDVDICIWVYQKHDRNTNNEMCVILGHHSDCKKNNMWSDKLTGKIIKDSNARVMHNKTRDYIIGEIEKIISKNLNIKI